MKIKEPEEILERGKILIRFKEPGEIYRYGKGLRNIFLKFKANTFQCYV